MPLKATFLANLLIASLILHVHSFDLKSLGWNKWYKTKQNRNIVSNLVKDSANIKDSLMALEERSGDGTSLLDTLTISKNNTVHISYEMSEIYSASKHVQFGRFMRDVIKSLLVPKGFRNRIPAEYVDFQKWNVLQDASSTLRGILATQAVFEGLGVGKGGISSKSIAMHWILRDGISKFAGLIFSSLSSGSLGNNPKRWRLFADIINNVGMTLDMLTPLFGRRAFMFALLLSSICKALCGIASASSSATLNQHWGSMLGGDVGDVVSASNALLTLSSIVVMVVGTAIFSRVARIALVAWCIYGILTVTHMIANYKAMKSVALRSLNAERLQILHTRLFDSPVARALFLENINLATNVSVPRKAVRDQTIETANADVSYINFKVWLDSNRQTFSPKAVAAIEPILPKAFMKLMNRYYEPTFSKPFVASGTRDCSRSISSKISSSSRSTSGLVKLSSSRQSVPAPLLLWCSPSSIAAAVGSISIMQLALELYKTERYFITLAPVTGSIVAASDGAVPAAPTMQEGVCICFAHDVTPLEVAQAMFEGELTRLFLREAYRYGEDGNNTVIQLNLDEKMKLIGMGRKASATLFPVWWKFLGGRNSDLSWDTAYPQLLPAPRSILSLSAVSKLFNRGAKRESTSGAPYGSYNSHNFTVCMHEAPFPVTYRLLK